jgi:protein-S-isoprenylcysteine O-methyltransferase Ste14
VLDASTIRLVALGLIGGFAAIVVATLRWELGGRSLKRRARTPLSKGVGMTWNVAQAVLFLYPTAVLIVPNVAYGTVLHFSFPLDTGVQIFAILLWAFSAGLLVWCSRTLGPIMLTDGVVEGHSLITRGPYAVIRHPTYTAFILLGFSVAMIFLSYLLLGLAILVLVLASAQARAEERLLASPEGFGEEYQAYMGRTGRFLPRVIGRQRPR